ncbi:MAG: hypothetical protein ACKVOA_01375 [Methylophilaceae bacterium]
MLFNVMHKIQSAFHTQDSQQNLGWMNTLSEMGALEALSETKRRLSKIDFSDVANLKNKIEIILEIDQNTYQSVKKITHKYLISNKINRDSESEIHNVVMTYQRQLYVNYSQFFETYQNQSKLKINDDQINLILARFLNATFMMAKWRYFDDQPAPIGTWTNVHNVIKYAENLAILNKNLFLYNYQIKETSIAALLKRGFMLDTLQKGNFSRLQIELTDQVLKIWATNPLIVNKYKLNRYQFFIALDNDRGPERVRAIEKFGEYRYWKTTRLADLIEAYLCAADTGKPLTAFGLEKIAPPSVMLKLFKKLRAEWCVEGYSRQRRKEVRNKSNKLLNVSHGFHEVYQRLYALQMTQTPKVAEKGDFSFELKVAMQNKSHLISSKQKVPMGTENWWLVDESSSGLAVDLGKEVNNWLEVGKLIGYTSPDDKDTFSIAEIKSLKKQKNGTYRTGLELISNNGVALQISRVGKDSASETLSGYFVDEYEGISSHFKTTEALLVKNEEKSSGKLSLIMPRSEYKRGAEYRINIDAEDRVLIVGRVLGKQRDWIHVELLI